MARGLAALALALCAVAALAQPQGGVPITPSPECVEVEAVVDEVAHVVELRVRVRVAMGPREGLRAEWGEPELRGGEVLLKLSLLRVSAPGAEAGLRVEERRFALGRLEPGVYKVSVVVNGEVVKTALVVVPGESGESRSALRPALSAGLGAVLLAVAAALLAGAALKRWLTPR